MAFAAVAAVPEQHHRQPGERLGRPVARAVIDDDHPRELTKRPQGDLPYGRGLVIDGDHGPVIAVMRHAMPPSMPITWPVI
jgi:hypothetical protein